MSTTCKCGHEKAYHSMTDSGLRCRGTFCVCSGYQAAAEPKDAEAQIHLHDCGHAGDHPGACCTGREDCVATDHVEGCFASLAETEPSPVSSTQVIRLLDEIKHCRTGADCPKCTAHVSEIRAALDVLEDALKFMGDKVNHIAEPFADAEARVVVLEERLAEAEKLLAEIGVTVRVADDLSDRGQVIALRQVVNHHSEIARAFLASGVRQGQP